MKDLHTSLDKGQENFFPVEFSKSQKALKPELYFDQVERDRAELSRAENWPCAVGGLVWPIDSPASVMDWRRNLFLSAYLSKPGSKRNHTKFLEEDV